MVWVFGTFVVHHSGATARDLHPIPHSPLTLIRGIARVFWLSPKRFKEPKIVFGNHLTMLAASYSVTRLSEKSLSRHRPIVPWPNSFRMLRAIEEKELRTNGDAKTNHHPHRLAPREELLDI